MTDFYPLFLTLQHIIDFINNNSSSQVLSFSKMLSKLFTIALLCCTLVPNAVADPGHGFGLFGNRGNNHCLYRNTLSLLLGQNLFGASFFDGNLDNNDVASMMLLDDPECGGGFGGGFRGYWDDYDDYDYDYDYFPSHHESHRPAVRFHRPAPTYVQHRAPAYFRRPATTYTPRIARRVAYRG